MFNESYFFFKMFNKSYFFFNIFARADGAGFLGVEVVLVEFVEELFAGFEELLEVVGFAVLFGFD